MCQTSVDILTAACMKVPLLNPFRDELEDLLELQGQELLDALAALHTNTFLRCTLAQLDEGMYSETYKADRQKECAQDLATISQLSGMPEDEAVVAAVKACSVDDLTEAEGYNEQAFAAVLKKLR